MGLAKIIGKASRTTGVGGVMMEGAIVKAYAQPNGGPVLLEIFVGDKRRGTISLRPSGDDGFDFA